MMDIIGIGEDITFADTQTVKAKNILSVQAGSLEYAPENFGVDLNYFLGPDFKFQNDSFRAYLVQVLTNFGINVVRLIETKSSLFNEYMIEIKAETSGDGFVAR